ncbi:MAG TPA: isoprenylcysteine carboxylmethyltransferase family protein [Methylocella sp.]|nr:isoprenylcysteine carboxylmethyltransferase family protein [Methylocella sp.]
MPKGSFGFQPSTDHPDIAAPPPLVFAAVIVLGLLIQWRWPLPFLPENWSFGLGLLIIFVAGNLILYAVRELIRTGTNIQAHRPATAIATSGAYSFSRNPIYLGLVLMNAGIACFFNSLWILALTALLAALLQKGAIEPEEAYLEKKFGAKYLRYKASVRRWI